MKFLIIIISFLIVACESNTISSKNNDSPEIIVIDGCEYISNHPYYGFKVLTHKGNCNNPIHKMQCNIEMDDKFAKDICSKYLSKDSLYDCKLKENSIK